VKVAAQIHHTKIRLGTGEKNEKNQSTFVCRICTDLCVKRVKKREKIQKQRRPTSVGVQISLFK
jgi:hypothetical protein